ncbi:hypothetical protein BpHYR1_051773 [Brachionus plicatilis]|uniref:Uncharacterized protein n=1 Tax=Brachionus plicatilis TaxID=10195 RepID=A0A3M7R6M3_BRAPC|nr:hypothetical protein BpHYR1_051773 [Brachionus plicatilis]
MASLEKNDYAYFLKIISILLSSPKSTLLLLITFEWVVGILFYFVTCVRYFSLILIGTSFSGIENFYDTISRQCVAFPLGTKKFYFLIRKWSLETVSRS